MPADGGCSAARLIAWPPYACVFSRQPDCPCACPLQITGRAVILPSLWCGMDRWWAPHAGTIPGSGLQLPYLCPADHVLDLEA